MPKERVYQAVLSPEDWAKVLEIKWRGGMVERVFLKLMEQNPRPEKIEGGGWWWSQNYQSSINSALRENGLPWRIVSTRKFDGRIVYLGTIVPTGAPSVGSVRHSVN